MMEILIISLISSSIGFALILLVHYGLNWMPGFKRLIDYLDREVEIEEVREIADRQKTL